MRRVRVPTHGEGFGGAACGRPPFRWIGCPSTSIIPRRVRNDALSRHPVFFVRHPLKMLSSINRGLGIGISLTIALLKATVSYRMRQRSSGFPSSKGQTISPTRVRAKYRRFRLASLARCALSDGRPAEEHRMIDDQRKRLGKPLGKRGSIPNVAVPSPTPPPKQVAWGVYVDNTSMDSMSLVPARQSDRSLERSLLPSRILRVTVHFGGGEVRHFRWRCRQSFLPAWPVFGLA